MPAIGVSLLLIAIGAILAFAVTATVQGVEIATVGFILMAVGGFGLLLGLAFAMSFWPWSRDSEQHYHDHV